MKLHVLIEQDEAGSYVAAQPFQEACLKGKPGKTPFPTSQKPSKDGLRSWNPNSPWTLHA